MVGIVRHLQDFLGKITVTKISRTPGHEENDVGKEKVECRVKIKRQGKKKETSEISMLEDGLGRTRSPPKS